MTETKFLSTSRPEKGVLKKNKLCKDRPVYKRFTFTEFLKEDDSLKDIYHRLREKLDDIASGFPATESGVEIQLLKRLFTTEEAALFLKLSPMIPLLRKSRLDRPRQTDVPGGGYPTNEPTPVTPETLLLEH